MQECVIDGCSRTDIASQKSGMCWKHYARWKRNGDPHLLKISKYPDGATCAVDGCERRRGGRAWCKMHYQRWLKHGDPVKVLKPLHVRAKVFIALVHSGMDVRMAAVESGLLPGDGS